MTNAPHTSPAFARHASARAYRDPPAPGIARDVTYGSVRWDQLRPGESRVFQCTRGLVAYANKKNPSARFRSSTIGLPEGWLRITRER